MPYSSKSSAMALIAAARYESDPPEIQTYRSKKPSTSTYEDNFNFAFSFYQPMIEYLDKKLSGVSTARDGLPHLPYTEELPLSRSRPSSEKGPRRTNSYTKRDIDNLMAASDRDQSRIRSLSYRASTTSSNSGGPNSSSSCDGGSVKLGVSKSTSASTLSAQYSMSKMSIRQALTSKSPALTALEQEGLERNRELKLAAMMSRSSGSGGVRRTRSFGAFTEKAVQDVTAELTVNAFQTIAGKYKYLLSRNEASEVTVGRESSRKVRFNELEMERPSASVSFPSAPASEPAGISKEQYLSAVKEAALWEDKSKQFAIEVEQLNSRLVEAETRLKTEVQRIKKKFQIQITEMEMSLDVANKTNISLQQTIKKQSIQITELSAHYDECQRQLQIALDQYGQAQRRANALQAELDEVRSACESAQRAKRAAEQAAEEAQVRVNELTTININLASAKTKIEQELSILSSDYDEVSKELKMADDRFQKAQTELIRTVEILHEEQERVVKIESIKKTLEIEVKNLTIRLEEVETNALVGGKRIISKLEARLRDMELEIDEEKRRHAETTKILRKKERSVKEMMMQVEEDQSSIVLLQEALDKVGQKANAYKRQLQEMESVSATSVTRVRRCQREMEAAEERAETAESNLSLIRAKHRSFVTTSVTPGQTGQMYVVQETRTQEY